MQGYLSCLQGDNIRHNLLRVTLWTQQIGGPTQYSRCNKWLIFNILGVFTLRTINYSTVMHAQSITM